MNELKPYTLRCVHRKRRLHAPNAVLQGDIRINRGRLRARVIVFKTPQELNAFWKARVGSSLGRGCLGAVSGLGTMVEEFPSRRRTWEVDARYFCLIGLTREHLTMRILSHEAVHAGYAFARRKSRNGWDQFAVDMDEEAIAYPAGEIGARLVSFLCDGGILETVKTE